MNWIRRLSDFLSPARRNEQSDLAKTRERHIRAIQKADHVIEDFRRADGVIEIRLARKPR